jgi:hypothetical protein
MTFLALGGSGGAGPDRASALGELVSCDDAKLFGARDGGLVRIVDPMTFPPARDGSGPLLR